jgi:hypothetical protein
MHQFSRLQWMDTSVFNTPPSAFKWLVWLLNTFCVVGCVKSGISLHLVSLCFLSALDFHFCAQAFSTGIQIASRASPESGRTEQWVMLGTSMGIAAGELGRAPGRGEWRFSAVFCASRADWLAVFSWIFLARES